MKQEQMMLKFQNFFNNNEDIRVFGLNGSRTNPNVLDDKFKDYDVVFFTDNVAKYVNDHSFMDQFGEILLATEPGHDGLYPPEELDLAGRHNFLVLYQSGLRIDWQFRPLQQLKGYLSEDTLTRIVGDKDGRVTESLHPNDRQYWLDRPSEKMFSSSVKEFWWEFVNTLKATVRQENFLAQFYLNLTREELIRMLTWGVATNHGFERSYGKQNQQTLKFLPPKVQRHVLDTFDTSSTNAIYASLKTMTQLENTALKLVGDKLNFNYQPLLALDQVPLTYLRSKDETDLATYFDQNNASLLQQLESQLVDWGQHDEDIDSLIVVGSYARGTQKPESDLDLVLITNNKAKFFQQNDFVNQFGKATKVQTEFYGVVTSIRATYEDASEIEFSIADATWIEKPLNPGTKRVLQGGFKVLVDKHHQFKNVRVTSDEDRLN
ncbi:aminoglycoside 6-adenylyltransferase [Lapidilactobacillus bayanensis]|uniref:aminoglycoside 6-adenylyltransferase n=1 Tax=Lapidilactobacillus bayanensis TaxID=2485998 RepID=UPI0013DE65F7|nr:aminoglycoside 6-adenylyltransferase [Lapidilactobacillus bayanensis]